MLGIYSKFIFSHGFCCATTTIVFSIFIASVPIAAFLMLQKEIDI